MPGIQRGPERYTRSRPRPGASQRAVRRIGRWWWLGERQSCCNASLAASAGRTHASLRPATAPRPPRPRCDPCRPRQRLSFDLGLWHPCPVEHAKHVSAFSRFVVEPLQPLAQAHPFPLPRPTNRVEVTSNPGHRISPFRFLAAFASASLMDMGCAFRGFRSPWRTAR